MKQVTIKKKSVSEKLGELLNKQKGGRDKAKDDEFFNCSQKHELEYVSSLYADESNNILKYLKLKCKNGGIKYSTHMDVYKMIKKDFGYPIPVETKEE